MKNIIRDQPQWLRLIAQTMNLRDGRCLVISPAEFMEAPSAFAASPKKLALALWYSILSSNTVLTAPGSYILRCCPPDISSHQPCSDYLRAIWVRAPTQIGFWISPKAGWWIFPDQQISLKTAQWNLASFRRSGPDSGSDWYCKNLHCFLSWIIYFHQDGTLRIYEFWHYSEVCSADSSAFLKVY